MKIWSQEWILTVVELNTDTCMSAPALYLWWLVESGCCVTTCINSLSHIHITPAYYLIWLTDTEGCIQNCCLIICVRGMKPAGGILDRSVCVQPCPLKPWKQCPACFAAFRPGWCRWRHKHKFTENMHQHCNAPVYLYCTLCCAAGLTSVHKNSNLARVWEKSLLCCTSMKTSG